jgi:Na+/H+-dicarboxylate symporter
MLALLIGIVFHGAGRDADKVLDNATNLFFGLLFNVLAAMMSTVLTCN